MKRQLRAGGTLLLSTGRIVEEERFDHALYERRPSKAEYWQRIVMVRTICQMEFAAKWPPVVVRDRVEGEMERDRR